MRLTRSIRRASVVAGVLTLSLAGSAFARDCYNASVSAKGALAKAEHSQVWVLAADVRELIATGGSGFFPAGSFPVLDSCQQAAFLTSYAQSGFPLVFTTADGAAKGQGGTIAENNPNMTADGLAANGKGIDHFEDTADAIFAAIGNSYNAAYAAACPSN